MAFPLGMEDRERGPLTGTIHFGFSSFERIGNKAPLQALLVLFRDQNYGTRPPTGSVFCGFSPLMEDREQGPLTGSLYFSLSRIGNEAPLQA